jgi:hypothetical protein
MRSCSNCEHWIQNQKRLQYNVGACNQPDRLAYVGSNVVLPLMFGYQSCERHSQKRETETEGAQA